MPKYCDFVVPYSEDREATTKTILSRLFLTRIKNKKPTIVLITGASGEAKSYISLAVADCLLSVQGVDLAKHLKDIEIFTPMQYAEKMKRLLYEKELKKVNVVIIDEAREVVDAKDWFNFVNRAIAHINAMFRRLKPMVIIIVTQYTGDVDKAIRKSITYWGACQRPIGRKPYLRLFRIWLDERDIENPKIRRRRVFGYMKKEGREFKVRPTFHFKMPRKELTQEYEQLNYDAKARIINLKLEALLKTLNKDVASADDKAESMAEFYAKKPELLNMVIERKRGKIVLKKEVSKMHDITPEEKKLFHEKLLNKLVERGIAHGDTAKETDNA